MIRRRPREHARKLRSGRRIIVNKGNKPVIRKGIRKVFHHLSNKNNYRDEFGGAIDFGHDGKVEQIHMEKGKGGSIELDPDYEVQWHTHPYSEKKHKGVPSPEDIVAIAGNPRQQAELIFTNGRVYSIIKTDKTKALSRLPATTTLRRLDKAFLSSTSDDGWVDHIRSLGFIVKENKKENKDLYIDVDIKEPVKR